MARTPESIEKQKATRAANAAANAEAEPKAGKKKRRAKKKRQAKKTRATRQPQRPVSKRPGNDLDACLEKLQEATDGLLALKQSMREVFGYE